MENQPPQYAQQQQPTIVMVPPQATRDQFNQRSLFDMRGLSIFNVVIGVLCVVFGAVLTGSIGQQRQYDYYGSVTGIISTGIWIGVYFVIVGGIGIGAVRWNSPCWIVSAMVLNIISSSTFCVILAVFSSAGIQQATFTRLYNSYPSAEGVITTNPALNCFLLLLAIAEFTITIWSAILCCGAVCRCCKPSQMNPQYYPTQQPMMYGGRPGVVAYHVGQPIAVQGQYVQPMGVQGQYVPPMGGQGQYVQPMGSQGQYAQPMGGQVDPTVKVQP